MKSIPTEYNGIEYRSLSEARWAVFFDSMGIRYMYEPEGFEFSDGTKYLPDFYLPETDTYFEVKGVMDKNSEKKIQTFMEETNKMIVIGYPDMTFECAIWWGRESGVCEPEMASCEDSLMSICSGCGKPMFFDSVGVYQCKSCGAYDGDHYLQVQAYGDSAIRDYHFLKNTEIVQKLKQARWAKIEYGQLVNKNSVFKIVNNVNGETVFIRKTKNGLFRVTYESGVGNGLFKNGILMAKDAVEAFIYAMCGQDKLFDFADKWEKYAITEE